MIDAMMGLKCRMHVPNIHVEGIVSQIFVLGHSFHFMTTKTAKCSYNFLIFFSKFYRK